MKPRSQLFAAAAAALFAGSASAALTTTYSADGNLGVEVDAYVRALTAGPGNFTLTDIPAGATIEQAYLYANNYFGAPLTSATFDGNALGPSAAYATDGTFSAYRFDVTAYITGNGVYSADYAGPTNSYGLALVVVFSDPTLPVGHVCINDGAVDFNQGTLTTSTTRCSGLAPGAGRAWAHTVADNALNESDDELLYNGVQVAAPIDANIGNFASLFNLAVTNAGVVNAMTINAPSDQFGWDFAVFLGSADVVVVPEPAPLALLGVALTALAWRRRRSR